MVGLVHCREVGGLEDSLSSCERQLQEGYRVEEPEQGREQSTSLGLRGGRSWAVISRNHDWGRSQRQELRFL